jgi:hypothetical protein
VIARSRELDSQWQTLGLGDAGWQAEAREADERKRRLEGWIAGSLSARRNIGRGWKEEGVDALQALLHRQRDPLS